MDSHTAIKVLLGRAHLDSNPESLHHLIDALAQDVETDNLLLGTFTHDLHLGGFFLFLLGWESGASH
jgi:hypothetical protein